MSKSFCFRHAETEIQGLAQDHAGIIINRAQYSTTGCFLLYAKHSFQALGWQWWVNAEQAPHILATNPGGWQSGSPDQKSKRQHLCYRCPLPSHQGSLLAKRLSLLAPPACVTQGLTRLWEPTGKRGVESRREIWEKGSEWRKIKSQPQALH